MGVNLIGLIRIERRGRAGCARGVADANRIDCEVMSNWGGADWGKRPPPNTLNPITSRDSLLRAN